MRKSRIWKWKPRPDRSFFVIALPFSFLLFLWALLMVDPFPRTDSLRGPRSRDISKEEPVSGPVDIAPAIQKGLAWLARHQFEDGSWDGYYFQMECDSRCGGNPREPMNGNPTGITALALLAFLEAGDDSKLDSRRIARKAARFLMGQQRESDGFIGSRDYPKKIYGHAMALYALARAYQLIGGPAIPRSIRRGITYLENARTPGKAWGYGFRDAGNDTSIAGWVCLALAESKRALALIDLDHTRTIPKEAFRGMHRWIEHVSDDYYAVNYSDRGFGSSRIPGVNDHYEQTEILTAIGMIVRLESGESPRSSDAIQEGIKKLGWDLPTWVGLDGACIDFCYWHFGLRALEMVSQNGKHPTLTKWQGRLGHILTRHQNDGDHSCRAGSWEPVDKWGCEGGRVYATAMNTLILSRLRN